MKKKQICWIVLTLFLNFCSSSYDGPPHDNGGGEVDKTYGAYDAKNHFLGYAYQVEDDVISLLSPSGYFYKIHTDGSEASNYSFITSGDDTYDEISLYEETSYLQQTLAVRIYSPGMGYDSPEWFCVLAGWPDRFESAFIWKTVDANFNTTYNMNETVFDHEESSAWHLKLDSCNKSTTGIPTNIVGPVTVQKL